MVNIKVSTHNLECFLSDMGWTMEDYCANVAHSEALPQILEEEADEEYLDYLEAIEIAEYEAWLLYCEFMEFMGYDYY